MADPVVGTIASAAIGARGAKKSAQIQADAADRAAQLQYQATLPKSVSGVFGDFTYDDESQLANISLSPELQKIYDARLARSQEQSELIKAYDPNAYQQEFYEEQKAWAARDEEQQRLDLENRLRRQGLLGSTTGALRTRSLYESQDIKDLRRRAEARNAAREQLTFMRGLEGGDITSASAIGSLGSDYANIGRGIGSNLGAAVQSGAANQFAAAQNAADATAAFWNKIGTGVGNSFSQPYMGSTMTPFTQGGYSGNVVTPSATYRAFNPNVGASFVPVQMQGGVPVPTNNTGMFGNIF